MKTFPTKTCPICGKTMFQKFEYPDRYAFRCPFQVKDSYPYTYKDIEGNEKEGEMIATEYHYEVLAKQETAGGRWIGTQTTIIPPYIMVNETDTGRTKVLQWRGRKLILDIPLLLPDRSEEKLALKLKTYVLFS